MNDKHDIEKILARYRISPGANVKREVLARFNDRFGATGAAPRPVAFWRRPVPLYFAVAAVVAALLVAVPMQNRLLPHGGADRQREAARPGDSGGTSELSDFEWNIAHSDLI